jgi:hypothetical protein
LRLAEPQGLPLVLRFIMGIRRSKPMKAGSINCFAMPG